MLLLVAMALAAAPAPDPRTAAVLAAVGAIPGKTHCAVAYADIGGDRRDEALVYLVDPRWCGSGGCSLMVLTPAAKGWRNLGQTSVTRLPVYRLLSGRGGWNDLAVGVGGGGSASGIAVLRFANGRYPANPTAQPQLNRLPHGARMLLSDRPLTLIGIAY